MKGSPYKQRAIMVRPRIYLGESIAIGPGKIDLLRYVAEGRSISAAARGDDLCSYSRRVRRGADGRWEHSR